MDQLELLKKKLMEDEIVDGSWVYDKINICNYK
jgi:hypothetical protein